MSEEEKMVITNRVKDEDFESTGVPEYSGIEDEQQALSEISAFGGVLSKGVLSRVEHQTEELCLAAVRKNPCELAHVHNQTSLVCLAAVNREGRMLRHVHNQTEELCIAAVRQNPSSFTCVHDQTEKICLTAVTRDWEMLEHVHTQTEELCLEAADQNIEALKFIRNREMYDTVVRMIRLKEL